MIDLIINAWSEICAAALGYIGCLAATRYNLWRNNGRDRKEDAYPAQ